VRQLTSLDAQFLALETSRQTGHVAGVAVYDTSTAPGGTLTVADLQQLISSRLHLLPPLRWRLEPVPLGLDYPYWVDDADFDLDFHVRELALPSPGTDQQLADQVARIVSRPLDRARPLWELYVISGLSSGYVAVLTKIHHALIDGISGAELTGLLLDVVPDAPTPAPQTVLPERRPGQWEMAARGMLGLSRYPLRALRAVPSAVPNLEESQLAALPGVARLGRLAGRAEGLLRGDGNRVIRPTMHAPKTSFSGRLSAHRRFAFGRLELARVKAVKNASGYTVNDVVVAICAGAVRRWLIENDELPTEPLIAQIPVSVRTSQQGGTYGNRILLLAVPLFTDEPDPVARLRRTHEALRVMKDRHRALPARLLADVNHFIPPAVFSRAARLTFSLATSAAGRPNWNLVVSNVPGPQVPLYCAGARLMANYPVSVITDGMGLNITAMSYLGHLDIGIVADRQQMADLWCLVGWMQDSLTELEGATIGPKVAPAS
jgi:diacylglycerol O-acyltransferase